ncbi:Glycine-rich domain-containing protein-like [Trema orientale]|uniref:Glycine-rich domain-containing protein-like n=1 Tax=Trema orientale TaxID=63057 RepID=A0A2P5BUS8_TREOI|nr:Glycine-rich domain-containing protein-like [Trema orientale]
MSSTTSGSEILANMSTRSLSEVSEVEAIRLGLDLVSAARRNIGFLRAVAESQWLHDQKPTLLEAIRRYNDLWMPLISDLTVGSTPPLILPPIDVEWVWFCHTLNPVCYREYCMSKFSKFIGKPAIFDEENEEYAVMRCREIWVRRYPNEPFENGVDSDQPDPVVADDYEELLTQVTNQRFLYSKFSEPYRSEVVYLIAARQRYKGFLYMMQRSTEVPSRLVPASDILLMWLTHQSYPTVYAEDLKEIDGGDTGKVVSAWETVTKKEVEDTKNLWETTFDQPYEKAGGEIGFNLDGVIPAKPPVYWEVSDTDVNTKYKSMLPRFLLEVCVFVRLKAEMKAMLEHTKRDILRLRMIRCHRELKLDKTVSNFSNESWQKAWHLYCEFGTKGLVIELRRLGGYCFKASTVEETATFHWNDLLRAPSLTLQRHIDQQVKSISSITPPVQAPYLLKCVPDHVTDDSGAMISDVILKMNQYRPQEGRWLSRSVLDHAGRECFVIRIRVGGGFWRRGGETPSTVKWEDRIIEIREGSWSYVAGSIGRAPEKVVGTATPKKPPEQWKSAWQFSTGDELMVRWESSMLISGLSFCLKNQSAESMVKLLKGRKMQYQVNKVKSQGNNSGESQNEQEEEDVEEEGFLTLVRFTEDDPIGRATALLNWKLLVVEFLPEEDAVFVLLLCISILRSVSDMKKEDLGCLLMRRRLKEARLGSRDWGSVVLHPFSSSSSPSPYLQPWYWNAKAVMVSDSSDNTTRPPAFSHSPEEGSDQLYKRGIFT